MRCTCCNVILTPQESVRKFRESNEYTDTCTRCLRDIPVPTIDVQIVLPRDKFLGLECAPDPGPFVACVLLCQRGNQMIHTESWLVPMNPPMHRVRGVARGRHCTLGTSKWPFPTVRLINLPRDDCR